MDIETRINELRGVLSDCLYKDRIRIEGELRKILSRSGRGTRVDVRLLERFLRDARRSVSARDLRGASLPALSYPEALPIIARKDEIVRAIHEHAVLVIAGETGSGKTTQIPKMCLEAGLGVHGRIGCTQPRRVAALSITRRIAEELGVRYGKEIGCKIRFADHTAPEAYIKIMTDGMLLAETQGDPLLSEYEVLIIDEAHERSLNIDFLLGYLKLLRRKRPELKIIITSATIDTEAFSRAFDNAPIIEVSGRLYPVETQHAPLDEFFEEAGEVTYIDAAVEAVSLILGDDAPEAGDILIFMPGERDILETRDRLEDEFRGRAEVIPLFARLSSREQHRIFGASPRRKIIVSTNIAETSLTIPGIRYVIDTGLARMSRYSPRTRTRRLPIEPISQSSANQRAGRCGRLANGVCIRLYSEDDFLERPRFTQPEIQRSNLAEVILRMKAFHLGEIETFPFLNPPQPQAIRAGYNLLEELGAMDEKRELTRLGLELARLPVDPAIGRIILQARTENALAEVLVIAAGLSIQDPRERPLEQRAAADTAHMRFRSEASDFLALLNIWNEFHDTWDRLKTQNQLRKFCKSNFLSYIRMREWNDTYNQLRQSLKECGRFRLNNEPASYAAIHRSILTGLIGHAAQKTSLNFYKGTMDRKFMVFPGSALFKKGLPKKKASGGDAPEAATHGGQPEWIVAGEILETSRVFAHTVAGIKPDWIAELGAHLCKSSYRDPYWDRKKGRVLVTEMINFRGLRVTERKVDYGRVSPEHATEVFIQSALVEERLPVAYGFIEHNREVRNRIEAWRTRLRSYDVLDPDAALFDFYKARLQSVSSLADLNRVIKQHARSGSGFLHVSEADLIGDTDLSFDHKAFPAYMMLGNTRVDIHYAFAPGEEEDGVTVRLPVELLPSVQPGMLDRIVPGLIEPKIDAYLRGLPKSHRRELVPVHEAAHAAAAELLHGEASLKESLRRWLLRNRGLETPGALLKDDSLPEHLHTRFEVIKGDGAVICAGRDLDELKKSLGERTAVGFSRAWTNAAARWERYDVSHWGFGDLPEIVELDSPSGVPFIGFPGLELDGASVNVRLFQTQSQAVESTPPAYLKLCELSLQKDLAWLRKDLRMVSKYKIYYSTFATTEMVEGDAYSNILRHLFLWRDPFPLVRARFDETVERARRELKGIAAGFIKVFGRILELRHELQLQRRPYPGMKEDLEALVPASFLRSIPFERLKQVPRYLEAMRIRAERAALNPAKDREKALRVDPFRVVLKRFRNVRIPEGACREHWDRFRWLVEEFKVSCFAQELGTSEPASVKRLNEQLDKFRREVAGG